MTGPDPDDQPGPATIAGAPAAEVAELRHAVITDSIDQMIWSTRPDGFHDFYNKRWYDYTGVPPGSTDGDAWNGMFHPDDQARAWATWRRSLATGEPYHIEYRLRHRSGQYRWVIGRAQCVRDADGRIARWYGTCTDVHDLKEAEEQRQLIAQELSHRIKNIFAVVTSLIQLSAAKQPEQRAFATTLRNRIGALATAHDYIRPHSPHSAVPFKPHTLHGLIRTLTAAYGTAGEPRVLLTGDDVPIGERAATALALVIHELSTNAVKYGALSQEGGQVEIACASESGGYRLVWRETGGPAVPGTPAHRGFGSTLSERVLGIQLGGTVAYDWQPAGLEVTLTVDRGRLVN